MRKATNYPQGYLYVWKSTQGQLPQIVQYYVVALGRRKRVPNVVDTSEILPDLRSQWAPDMLFNLATI